jgi:integrase
VEEGQAGRAEASLKLKEIWAIRIRLQLDHRTQARLLLNLAIEGKLRGCDLVGLRVHDVVQGGGVVPRAMVMPKKTQRPAQFEITEQAREAVGTWIEWQRWRGQAMNVVSIQFFNLFRSGQDLTLAGGVQNRACWRSIAGIRCVEEVIG